ncbi:hypothetical protein [Hyphomicrobium sp.]|uniref:hypothetical protein n=1 Tax=Hyphomicrobium sp. TaxID=82 RepID=UPI002E312FF3|nr:hypothetical protein [Hyphomicrobium sp.]HEX2842629.1 hypothetical protein [Hyphomicrobium sp.]
MSNSFIYVLSALGFSTLALAATLPASAQAAIVCKDGFQDSGGNWISTPYCNDAHLAQIARSRGARVSDAEIRENPNRKDEICRFLSGNPNAQDYCPDSDGPLFGR